MTHQQEIDLVNKMLKDEPMETVGHFALLKLSESGIKCNAATVELSTDATFEGVRYKCKMVITYTKI